jgi:hypothetical protein
VPEFLDVEQGSPEWHQLRCGIATASEFNIILRDGEASKTLAEYRMKKAGEVLTGQPAESYSNWHHERGKLHEPLARDAYAEFFEIELDRIGFVKNGLAGCSPDSLISPDGGLETKSMLPHLLIPILVKQVFPSQFKAQCQGNIWICEREWWDLAIFWPGLPLYVQRIHRDDHYIARLKDAVSKFNEEVAEIVERVRAGKRPPFADQLRASLALSEEITP